MRNSFLLLFIYLVCYNLIVSLVQIESCLKYFLQCPWSAHLFFQVSLQLASSFEPAGNNLSNIFTSCQLGQFQYSVPFPHSPSLTESSQFDHKAVLGPLCIALMWSPLWTTCCCSYHDVMIFLSPTPLCVYQPTFYNL